VAVVKNLSCVTRTIDPSDQGIGEKEASCGRFLRHHCYTTASPTCMGVTQQRQAHNGLSAHSGVASTGGLQGWRPSISRVSPTPIDRRQTRPYTAPPSCPGGGIGRRGGFKIRFRKEWEFESPPGHHESKPARHWSCGLFRFYRNNAGNCCKQVAGKLFQPLGKPRKTWPATLPAGVGNCAKLSVE
jgi:hypothetical protein